jgi:hypothetical protein
MSGFLNGILIFVLAALGGGSYLCFCGAIATLTPPRKARDSWVAFGLLAIGLLCAGFAGMVFDALKFW